MEPYCYEKFLFIKEYDQRICLFIQLVLVRSIIVCLRDRFYNTVSMYTFQMSVLK